MCYFQSSPYSPECSSNSSDYSGGLNTRIGNRTIEPLNSHVVPTTVPDRQDKDISECKTR